MKLDEIPRVRIVAPDGTLREEGYYFQMPESMGYPIICEGEKPKEIPILHCVITYTPGDWGMQNTLRVIRVTPPHKIKVVQPLRTAKSDEVYTTSIPNTTYENFRRAEAYPEVLAALKKAVKIIDGIVNEECCCYGYGEEISEVEDILKKQSRKFSSTPNKRKTHNEAYDLYRWANARRGKTAFHNAEKRLCRRGFTVINPLNIGRSIASDEIIAGNADLLKTVMRIERQLIRHCDAIYLLEGWEESEGSKAELVTAIGFDCMIFLESEDVEARQEKECKNVKMP